MTHGTSDRARSEIMLQDRYGPRCASAGGTAFPMRAPLHFFTESMAAKA